MSASRRGQHQITWDRATTGAVILLLLVTVATALAVVYSRHEARDLFNQLELLKKVGDDAAVEWDRLQLEESTFSTHSLIDQKARARLQMAVPRYESVEHIAR